MKLKLDSTDVFISCLFWVNQPGLCPRPVFIFLIHEINKAAVLKNKQRNQDLFTSLTLSGLDKTSAEFCEINRNKQIPKQNLNQTRPGGQSTQAQGQRSLLRLLYFIFSCSNVSFLSSSNTELNEGFVKRSAIKHHLYFFFWYSVCVCVCVKERVWEMD